MNDITKLRAEVKQMAVVAQQLEPYVKQFSVQNNLNDLANLQALIEKINLLQGNQSDQRSQYVNLLVFSSFFLKLISKFL